MTQDLKKLQPMNMGTRISEFFKDSKKPMEILRTGFKDIDRNLAYGGIQKDILLYLYAKASVGKTYFVTNWINRLLLKGDSRRIVFFSLEMSFENILNRYLQLVLGCGLFKVMETVIQNENVILGKLAANGFIRHVAIYTGGHDLNMIDRVLEAEKPDIFFLDHLHRIKHKSDNIFQKTTALSNGMFELKQKHQTRAVVLCQLKRQGNSNGKEEKHPGAKMADIEDAKGSGAIEEDADMILSIARPEINPNIQNEMKRQIHGRFVKNKFGSKNSGEKIVWKYDPDTSELMDVLQPVYTDPVDKLMYGGS